MNVLKKLVNQILIKKKMYSCYVQPRFTHILREYNYVNLNEQFEWNNK